MQEITTEIIRALAAANGITITEDRLESVRREYESFMRTVRAIDALPLARETEPAAGFALAHPAPPAENGGR